MVDIEDEDSTTKITRFANYLRNVLPANDLQVMVLASKALGRIGGRSYVHENSAEHRIAHILSIGKIAVRGGTLTADIVEFEAKRALEWLQGDRQEAKRLSAVLVLKELAVNTPTLIFQLVDAIMRELWQVLKDPKVCAAVVYMCLYSVHPFRRCLFFHCTACDPRVHF